jgi:hypothetical protein
MRLFRMGSLPFIGRAGLALTFRALAATIRTGFPVLAAGSART